MKNDFDSDINVLLYNAAALVVLCLMLFYGWRIPRPVLLAAMAMAMGGLVVVVVLRVRGVIAVRKKIKNA